MREYFLFFNFRSLLFCEERVGEFFFQTPPIIFVMTTSNYVIPPEKFVKWDSLAGTIRNNNTSSRFKAISLFGLFLYPVFFMLTQRKKSCLLIWKRKTQTNSIMRYKRGRLFKCFCYLFVYILFLNATENPNWPKS